MLNCDMRTLWLILLCERRFDDRGRRGTVIGIAVSNALAWPSSPGAVGLFAVECTWVRADIACRCVEEQIRDVTLGATEFFIMNGQGKLCR